MAPQELSGPNPVEPVGDAKETSPKGGVLVHFEGLWALDGGRRKNAVRAQALVDIRVVDGPQYR